MDQITTAIYENGILRPAVALDLPEHSEVEITIHANGDSLNDNVARAHDDSFRDKVRKALGSHRVEYKYDAEPVSEARRAELAELFSGDPPVSSYIREDRDSRDDSI